MSQFIDGPRKTFLAGTALGINLRVKITDASTSPVTVGLAGASDPCIGVTEEYVASGDRMAIRLANGQGTFKASATAAAITGGNHVYAAAAGQVAASGTVVEGRALETTAGAAGEILEVLPVHNSDIATAIVGTTHTEFEIDTDASIPKISLASYVGGSGDFTTKLKPESTLSGDNTITVPEADGDVLAAVALAQTLTNKTLTTPTISAHIINSYTTTPVAAAGSTVADGGQLPATDYCHITSDSATKGVLLPTGVKGMVITIVNNSSTACELYAASGGTVNGAAADASVVITASLPVVCLCTAADTWIVYDLGAVAAAS